jgi:phage anti-repressor protein
MKELIPIKTSPTTGNPVIDARILHDFLEAKQDFSTWIQGRIKKYDFIENMDYARIFYDVHNNRLRLPKKRETDTQILNRIHRIEYALTMECAKELSMVQNNEKGRQARRYFIDVEKKYRELKEGKNRIYTMSEVAKKLELSDYFGKIGRNRFYEILRHKGIVDYYNRPYNTYVDSHYFLKYPTRVTETGLRWLAEMFSNNMEIQKLKQEVQKLSADNQAMKKGVVLIAETLFYNKGGNKTAEQNRMIMNRLHSFIEANGDGLKPLT